MDTLDFTREEILALSPDLSKCLRWKPDRYTTIFYHRPEELEKIKLKWRNKKTKNDYEEK